MSQETVNEEERPLPTTGLLSVLICFFVTNKFWLKLISKKFFHKNYICQDNSA